ncbi:Two-component response regulator-like APRR9 [Hibiscus syriacus]|uniref:Two-component response regulator-like APRR9 n=1 Tax=Hibiscus syriacus TaxID=106335 RepID=A0A6A3AU57_HIBSY|nr:Two-component response regulator-like APRR9 [Hibiscus syriacus]
MGQVVVISSEEVVEERFFFPTMALRVLLIEANDLTRQIIVVVLKKCNYRAVSAVPDGFKAWEMLKGKPHKVDLILTEDDLPSISGFALLSLIMEHEICKGIAVIMMSSQDSISTVYKCMLRGAADYLVKPKRRNELRNLWQHVWRRQPIFGGNFPGGESIGYKQVEVTSENDAAGKAESADIETMQEVSDIIKESSQPKELQMHGAGYAIVNSPREIIDFMGTFNRNCSVCSINNSSKFDSSPHLDLSLRRHNHNFFKNNVTREGPILWHPNSSAFTMLVSFPLHSTLTSISKQNKESGTNSETLLSEYNADTPSPTPTSQRSMIPLTTAATDESEQTEVAASCMEQRLFPVPVSSRDVRSSSQCDGHNSVISSIYCAQSSSSPTPIPSSAKQQEPAFHVNLFHHSNFGTNSFEQFYDRLASGTNQSTNKRLYKPDQKLDSIEDKCHISLSNNQSGTSSFYNGSLSQHNGIAYGSTGVNNNVDQVATVQASTKRKNINDFPNPTGNPHHSMEREAVLTKFRLKRKDRCYEKKVRYESRKKLAEQRPRVKVEFLHRRLVDCP